VTKSTTVLLKREHFENVAKAYREFNDYVRDIRGGIYDDRAATEAGLRAPIKKSSNTMADIPPSDNTEQWMPKEHMRAQHQAAPSSTSFGSPHQGYYHPQTIGVAGHAVPSPAHAHTPNPTSSYTAPAPPSFPQHGGFQQPYHQFYQPQYQQPPQAHSQNSSAQAGPSTSQAWSGGIVNPPFGAPSTGYPQKQHPEHGRPEDGRS